MNVEQKAPGTNAWMAEVLRGAASQIEVLGRVSYVDHLRSIAAYLDARALEQREGRAGGAVSAWRHPDEVPDVPAGGSAYLWVAVKRNGDGRVYSFPAQYLNAMLLCDEWGDGAERSGNRYQHGPVDEDDGSFPATGWHSAKEHGEYESVYQPLLGDGDELVAWREVPSYPATTPPAPVVPEGMVLAEVLRRVAADPDGLLVLARLAKAETGRLREQFAAMLAAAQQQEKK